MKELIKDYKKYRWFITSTGILVVGGKNATQNDELLKKIKKIKEDFIVMHTASPGSPFSIILEDVNKINEADLDETAIFTGCFSQAWKSGKKAEIDIFKISQINKSKIMKAGTWRVSGKIERMKVSLRLSLVRQKGVLRGVPAKYIKKKDSLLIIEPGKKIKDEIADEIIKRLGEGFKREEVLSALPAGGIKYE